MKNINFNKVFYGFSLFAISFCFFIIGLITYWLIYPIKVLEFGPENGIIITKEVKSGEYVEMKQDFCKYVDVISQVDRQFIDSIVYQVPISYNNRPLGCHKKIEYIYIPKALPPGEYHISTTIRIALNPLRTVIRNVQTNKFIIIE